MARRAELEAWRWGDGLNSEVAMSSVPKLLVFRRGPPNSLAAGVVSLSASAVALDDAAAEAQVEARWTSASDHSCYTEGSRSQT
jgi:hypothetical protein